MPKTRTVDVKVPVRRPRDWPYDFSKVRVDDTVVIVPEPNNAVDKNALRIDDLERGTLGYVPAPLAAKITPQLQAKAWALVGAQVTEIDRNATWVDVFVSIRLKVPETN